SVVSRSPCSTESRTLQPSSMMARAAPSRTDSETADSWSVVNVLREPTPAAVSIPAIRRTISARTSFTWARNSGSARRRYTVRRLTPALSAAFSGDAPQANAKITPTSAFFLRPAKVFSHKKEGQGTLGGGLALPLRLLARECFPTMHDDVA